MVPTPEEAGIGAEETGITLENIQYSLIRALGEHGENFLPRGFIVDSEGANKIVHLVTSDGDNENLYALGGVDFKSRYPMRKKDRDVFLVEWGGDAEIKEYERIKAQGILRIDDDLTAVSTQKPREEKVEEEKEKTELENYIYLPSSLRRNEHKKREDIEEMLNDIVKMRLGSVGNIVGSFEKGLGIAGLKVTGEAPEQPQEDSK